jgi:hypothetical protein
MDKSLTLRSFETLYQQLSSEDQRMFLREHSITTDILVVYNNGCAEISDNFSSMEDLRKFTINYVCGRDGICAEELIGRAHKKYLEMMKNIIDDCPVPHYYDFWKAHICNKELKNYPLETLFTIINFAYEIGIDESKKRWAKLVTCFKSSSKWEREENMEKIWPKEEERKEMVRHIEGETIPQIYLRGKSNI